MRKNVEVIKTLVLWMLFISSMALFAIRYNLIGYSFSKDSSMLLARQNISKENIIPSHIIIKMSQYDMTSIVHDKDDYIKLANNTLESALIQDSYIKKISALEYKTAKKAPNMLLIFDEIPSIYFDDIINLKKSLISDMGYINEMLFSLKSQNIFIKTVDDFYQINYTSEREFQIVDELFSKAYLKYYPKFENMNSNENLILPLSINIQLGNRYTNNILEEIKTSDIAKNILKDRFDFTSSMIQKNGDYFYSYNNGQEILKITNDGFIEYKNEAMENVLSDLDKSTEAMMSFLSQIGINRRNIVISSVKEFEKNSGTVYRFNLSYNLDGIEALMQNSSMDSYVEISGYMVVAAKLYLRYISDYETDEKKSIVDPTKALNAQIDFIKKDMSIKDVEKLIRSIEDIRLIYSLHEGGVLIPVWRYKIADRIFIIDAVTEELINYGMVKN